MNSLLAISSATFTSRGGSMNSAGDILDIACGRYGASLKVRFVDLGDARSVE
jgi:hypothetical protein